MKASELRIGNFVNLYGDDCRIQTVGMWVHTETTVDEAPIESVKPILLTEEWLLKFGFNQNQYQGKTISYTKDPNERKDVFVVRRVCIEPISEQWPHFSYMASCRVYLRYVHQLQNLYFALTGEELTIIQ